MDLFFDILGVVTFIGLMVTSIKIRSMGRAQEFLVDSVRGLRSQNIRDRSNTPSERPTLRNRELMKAGDRIADGSLHN